MAVRSSPYETNVPEGSPGHAWIDAGDRVTRSEARQILGVTPKQFDRIAHWDATFPKPLDGKDADETYSVHEIHDYRQRIAAVLAAISDRKQSNGTIVTSEQESVFTLPAMAAYLDVHPKTLDRWTRFDPPLQGAMGACRGRLIKVLTEHHVRTFAQAHPDTVAYAQSFRRMTAAEREAIIAQANERAQNHPFFADVIRTLAAQTGRSIETIRVLLKAYVQEHPDCPLSQMKEPPNEQEALKLDLEFVENEMFEEVQRQPEREQEILDAAPSDRRMHRQQRSTQRKQKETDPYLQHLYEVPLLTVGQEQHLFRKMNYLKFRAHALQERLKALNVSQGREEERKDLAESILALYAQAEQVRNDIISANLRLVVSITKKFARSENGFWELVSDGNQSLMRAVDKFDFARGFKFSTYATWAIQKNFSRSIPREARQRGHLFDPTKVDSIPEPVDTRAQPQLSEATDKHDRQNVAKLLSHLDPREQEIIVLRFGLRVPIPGISESGTCNPHTLNEIGALLGVTKERIRQLQDRAMAKLERTAHVLGFRLEEG